MAAFFQPASDAFLSPPLRGGTRQDAASPSRGRAAGGAHGKTLGWGAFGCPVRVPSTPEKAVILRNSGAQSRIIIIFMDLTPKKSCAKDCLGEKNHHVHPT